MTYVVHMFTYCYYPLDMFSSSLMIENTHTQVAMFENKPFFFRFSLTAFQALSLGAEGYCRIWSHTMRHTHTHSVGFTWTRDQPVSETSTCTINYIQKSQTSMPPPSIVGFEPGIPASERPQTQRLRSCCVLISLYQNIVIQLFAYRCK